jgi:hypothetical protein
MGHANSNVSEFHHPAARERCFGVTAGQLDAAGHLTPERLGFDHLTELPVVRAVVPTFCINPHLLVPLLRHKW